MAGRQGREELIKKGLLEMMERGKWGPEAVEGGAAIRGPRVWRRGLSPSRASQGPFPVGAIPCQACPEVPSHICTRHGAESCHLWGNGAGWPSVLLPRAGGIGFCFEFRHDPRLGQVVLTHMALSYPVTLGKHRRGSGR